MAVLLVGYGYIGKPLALALAQAGREVFVLSRKAQTLPPGLTLIQADLTQPETLQHLPRTIRALLYLPAPDEGSEQAYRRVYVDGLRNILQALPAPQELERIIFVSSTAVYAENSGAWVDETSPTEPSAFNGKVLLEAENLALGSSAQTIIARLGGIYGPVLILK